MNESTNHLTKELASNRNSNDNNKKHHDDGGMFVTMCTTVGFYFDVSILILSSRRDCKSE